jgi:tetratricopeptide (TPR) repeat protein
MATAQYSDACEAYNRAINLNPNDPQVWCSLGVLYYAFGQYKESLGMLARAIKLDPTMADAWYNVGALYDMCDQPEDAQLAYLKARENGLADRFARAGMGLNPVAMQSLQYIASSNSSGVAGEYHVSTSSSSSAHAAQVLEGHMHNEANIQSHEQVRYSGDYPQEQEISYNIGSYDG